MVTIDYLPVVAAIVLACAAVVSIQARLASLGRRMDRLSRIEGKLDVIMNNLGLRFEPSADIPPDALAAMRAGRKIDAIKAYRRATNAGLAEAKDRIEEAMRQVSPRV